MISIWKACRGARDFPAQKAQKHVIYSSQASRASATAHAHRRSAHSRLSRPGGPAAAGGGLWSSALGSVYGIGDLEVRPLGTWHVSPRDSISAGKPVFNLGLLGSCQPAGHATFLRSPPRLRKASFCSTSRKLNRRKLPNPIATDCPRLQPNGRN